MFINLIVTQMSETRWTVYGGKKQRSTEGKKRPTLSFECIFNWLKNCNWNSYTRWWCIDISSIHSGTMTDWQKFTLASTLGFQLNWQHLKRIIIERLSERVQQLYPWKRLSSDSWENALAVKFQFAHLVNGITTHASCTMHKMKCQTIPLHNNVLCLSKAVRIVALDQ